MNIFYEIFLSIRFLYEAISEVISNSFRNTFIGPKRFTGGSDVTNKVVVITGANTGIGKETAREMVRRGAQVIIACRDLQKGNTAAKEISAQYSNANIKVMKLDLSSLSSVRQFARQLLQTHKTIDILINNAGVMACPHSFTEDGFEMQFGTNHLGHFLLTLLLLNAIKNSSYARIVNVSSLAHMRGKIHFDDIDFKKEYSPQVAYGQSKLANVLFTRELARRLPHSNVKVYALHPGIIDTELMRHAKGMQERVWNAIKTTLAKDPLLGAQTTLYCALEPSLSSQSGSYYSNCTRVDNMTANATDDVSAKRLWDLSCDLTSLDDKLRLA